MLKLPFSYQKNLIHCGIRFSFVISQITVVGPKFVFCKHVHEGYGCHTNALQKQGQF